jgi:hypothetical protein
VVACGRAHPGPGTPPCWPWAEALTALFASVPPETVTAALAPQSRLIARLVPELGVILPPGRHDDVALPASTARSRLAEAVTRGLARIAEQTPIVLVLEDLHRADPASLFLLRYLMAAPPIGSLLLVATYRTGDAEPDVVRALAPFRSRRSLTWTELAGVDDDAVGELLAALGCAGLGRDDVAAIGERTGGNPLLVEETARAVRRAGPAAVDGLPTDGRGLLGHHLAALPAATRRLLDVLAVVGDRVDLAVLEPIVGNAASTIVPAVDSGAVVALDGSGSSFRFRHELLRTTIYDQLERARRAELHGVVGVALKHAEGRPADEVAEHLWRAVDGGLATYADLAVGAALAAADAALDLSSVEQAEDQLERAGALLDTEARPDVRSAREAQVGARWVRLHELDKGLLAREIPAAVRRIWRAVRGPAVVDEMAATGRTGWTHHVLRGELNQARALAEDLVRRGTEAGEPSSLTVGLVGLGHVRFLSGAPQAALAALERALAIAEGNDASGRLLRRERVRARAFLSPLLELVGESPRAGWILDGALAHAARPDDAVELHLLAALAGVVAGDPRRTLAASREAEDVARSCSLGLHAPLARTLTAWSAARLGDPSAEWDLDEALHQLDAMGLRWLRALRLGLRADAAVAARGALDDGLECLNNALAEVATTGERVYEPELHRMRAESLAALGEAAAAEAALARALESAQVTGATVFEERIRTTAHSLHLSIAG